MSRSRLFGTYAAFLLIGGIVGGILTTIITRDEADDMISTYLKNDKLTQATGNAFGGTFPKEYLFVKGEKAIGVRFWFCYNETNPNYPKMFLAAEKLSAYQYPEFDEDPVPTAILYTTDTPFEYSGPIKPVDLKQGDIYNHLNKRKEAVGNIVSITGAEVAAFSKAFQSRVVALKLENYLNYRFTFFLYDNNDFKKFYGQNKGDVTYVRYYFGFNDEDSMNKIRVVLVAANSNNENLVEQNSILLQKSIPPPPDL